MAEHELHKRRLGRNAALGVLLLAFVALVFAVTIAKLSCVSRDADGACIAADLPRDIGGGGEL